MFNTLKAFTRQNLFLECVQVSFYDLEQRNNSPYIILLFIQGLSGYLILERASEHVAYAFLTRVSRITSAFIVFIILVMFAQVPTNAIAVVHDG